MHCSENAGCSLARIFNPALWPGAAFFLLLCPCSAGWNSKKKSAARSSGAARENRFFMAVKTFFLTRYKLPQGGPLCCHKFALRMH